MNHTCSLAARPFPVTAFLTSAGAYCATGISRCMAASMTASLKARLRSKPWAEAAPSEQFLLELLLSLGLAAMAMALGMVLLAVVRLLEPKSAKEDESA